MKTMKRILIMLSAIALVLTGMCLIPTKADKVEAIDVPTQESDVDKGMLDVKAQTTADGSVIRFVTSVDSLNYHKVGFKITPEGGETITHPIKTVFEKIESTTEGVEYKFSPKVVDSSSEFLATAKMKVNNAALNYTVQAFVVLLDGETTVYGAERYISANDGLASTPINMSFEVDANTATVLQNALDNGTQSAVVSASYEEGVAADGVEVIYVDGTTVHARVDLNGSVTKDNLKSATKFIFKLTSDGSEIGTAVHRNYYTSYEDGGADITWFTAYNYETTNEFVIATDADMYGFAKLSNEGETFAGKTVTLISDVAIEKNANTANGYPTNITNTWTPISDRSHWFRGTFDGDSNTISGLFRENPLDDEGLLFGRTDETAVLKDFHLANSYLKNVNGDGQGYYIGLIVGRAYGGENSSLESIHIDEDVVIETDCPQVGGFIGRVNGVDGLTISDCRFAGEVKQIGKSGLVDGYAGGFVGYIEKNVFINNCLNEGSVSSDVQNVGGFVGKTIETGGLTINNCKFSGEVKQNGKSDLVNNSPGGYVGGYVGSVMKNISITDSVNEGLVSSDLKSIGGFIGWSGDVTATISDCWFAGEVQQVLKDELASTTLNVDIGASGFIGFTKGTVVINNSHNNGSVSSNTKAIGGFIGFIWASRPITITNSLNNGTVTYNNENKDNAAFCGSMIGWMDAGSITLTIDKVYTTCNVVGTEDSASIWTGIGTKKGTISGSFERKTDNQLKGTTAFTDTRLFESGDAWIASTNSPLLRKFADTPSDWYYGEFEGTTMPEAVTYSIDTAEEFIVFQELVDAGETFAGDTVQLEKSIDLNPGWVASTKVAPEEGVIWNPIGQVNYTYKYEYYYFDGIFDGKGNTIRGLYVSASEDGAGLFSVLGQQGTIKNLQLANSYIEQTSEKTGAGALVGCLRGDIESIYVRNDVVVSGTSRGRCGGIVGDTLEGGSNISQCWFAGQVSSTGQATGGIVGIARTQVSITNCLNTGVVAGGSWASGGIIGEFTPSEELGATLSIVKCLTTGTVTGTGWVGSFVGGTEDYNSPSYKIEIRDSYYSTSPPPVGATRGACTVDNQAVPISVENLNGDSALTNAPKLFDEGIWVTGTVPMLKQFATSN